MKVYDVLVDECPKCYGPSFVRSGKLAKFEERLTGLAAKFDDKPRCIEGCTADGIDYIQNLHDTFVEESAASEINALHTYLVDDVMANMRCQRSKMIEKRITNAEVILVGTPRRLANYNKFL